MALASSLTVTRVGDDNVLTWVAQPGVGGYEVWTHDSPWVKKADVVATDTTYTDFGAPAGRYYAVTAFAALNGDGYLSDINTEAVPGYTAVPTGTQVTQSSPTVTLPSTSGGGGGTIIPGVEPALLVAALAGAVWLVRRRLA
jgi:hypothetical protein